MSKIKIDTAKLDKVLTSAFKGVVNKVGQSMKEVIEDEQAFADQGSIFLNRDIVLSGDLRDSQTVEVQGNRATFSWDPTSPEGENYAARIYSGFTLRSGRFFAGRNWPERGLDRAQAAQTMADELNAQGIAAKVTDIKKIA